MAVVVELGGGEKKGENLAPGEFERPFTVV